MAEYKIMQKNGKYWVSVVYKMFGEEYPTDFGLGKFDSLEEAERALYKWADRPTVVKTIRI